MSDLNLTQDAPAAALPRPSLSRLNLFLLGAAVVQLLIVAWVYWPRPSGPSGVPLLPNLTAEQVTRLVITGTDDQTVELERADSGWVLAGTEGYPANTEKITTTLTSLIGLTTDRMVTGTAGSHARLQVAEDNYVRRITLTTPDGNKVVYLGSSAGAGATHARVDGDDATYLIGGLATWDLETTPSAWVNPSYFTLPADQVTTFTLKNSAGTLTFVKDANGAWTLQDATADEQVLANNISSLLTRATSINLITPLGTTQKPEYGMASPTATLTLETENEQNQVQTYTLVLGAKDASEDSYILKASNSPHFVRIAAYTGDEFANKTRADFLAPAENPAAAPVSPLATPEISATAAITPNTAITPSVIAPSEVMTDTNN